MHTPMPGDSSFPQSALAVTPRSKWEMVRHRLSESVHRADFWEPADPAKPVTVADIQSLRAFAGRTATGPYKVAVLHDASAFRIETANALLKLLEEPPDGLYLILLSERPHVLPTVRSRVREVALFGGSATMEGDGNGSKKLWEQLIAGNPLTEADARDRLTQLSYLQTLIHTTIKPESVLAPSIRDHP